MNLGSSNPHCSLASLPHCQCSPIWPVKKIINLLSSRINLCLNASYLHLKVTVYVLDIKLISRFWLNISCEWPSAGIGLGIRDSFGKSTLGNAKVDVVEYILYCREEGGGPIAVMSPLSLSSWTCLLSIISPLMADSIMCAYSTLCTKYISFPITISIIGP